MNVGHRIIDVFSERIMVEFCMSVLYVHCSFLKIIDEIRSVNPHVDIYIQS
jgi:hypothetical protein